MIPRRFQLHRREDVSGVSGPGIVAYGVQFGDGTCAMRWQSHLASTAVYDSVEVVEAIHGHEGRTVVEWIDEERYATQMIFERLPSNRASEQWPHLHPAADPRHEHHINSGGNCDGTDCTFNSDAYRESEIAAGEVA